MMNAADHVMRAYAYRALTPTQIKRLQPARWLPRGEAVDIDGFRIDGGVYVGGFLPHESLWLDDFSVIDPALRVDASEPVMPDHGPWIWFVQYRRLSPSARRAYLAWLAAGRRQSDAPIYYPALYLCTLERRLVLDALRGDVQRGEILQLIQELEGLLVTYDRHRSFRSAAQNLLSFVRHLHGLGPLYRFPVLATATNWHWPISLQIGLSQMVAERHPLPPDWALAWIFCRCDPYQTALKLPSPEKFLALFRRRYHEETMAGLVIPPNRARLRAAYQPMSAPTCKVHPPRQGYLADVVQQTRPLRYLQGIVEDCRIRLQADDPQEPTATGQDVLDLMARAVR